MRIAIDVSPLSHPRTGIGNFLRGWLAALAEAASGTHELVAFAPVRPRGKRLIEDALAGISLEQRLAIVPFSHRLRQAWSRLGHPAVERLIGPLDVLHFSDWMYPPQRGGVRATTIYDLVPLRFPGWATPRTRRMHGAKYENAARTCDLVFAISRYTADDVEERLGIPRERIRVAYPGIDPGFSPAGPRADLGGAYVLTVSTLEPRKNLEALVAAFRVLRARRPELTLAVAGAEGWGEQPALAAEGVRVLGFVSDEELARLYRGASVFAYPSRFEGFGMPVVEAMACGVPVVASSHPSLDEASGEAARRADPSDSAAFADAIEQALDRGGENRDLGLEHAARFTWSACASAILAGYEAVA